MSNELKIAAVLILGAYGLIIYLWIHLWKNSDRRYYSAIKEFYMYMDHLQVPDPVERLGSYKNIDELIAANKVFRKIYLKRRPRCGKRRSYYVS